MSNVSNRELQDWLYDFAQHLEGMWFGKGVIALVREAAKRMPVGFEYEEKPVCTHTRLTQRCYICNPTGGTK